MRLLLICTLLLTGVASAAGGPDLARLQQEVADTERAFAKTMADRDFAAFKSYLAEETVWFGPEGALRGSRTVAEKWKSFYEGEKAPFSWKPDTVEVLDSGMLALTSGPVYDPSGKQTATFTSIWRRRPDGRWEIIFDRGNEFCGGAKP